MRSYSPTLKRHLYKLNKGENTTFFKKSRQIRTIVHINWRFALKRRSWPTWLQDVWLVACLVVSGYRVV